MLELYRINVFAFETFQLCYADDKERFAYELKVKKLNIEKKEVIFAPISELLNNKVMKIKP